MSTHNRAGHDSPLKSNSQELREKGLTVVSHIFKPIVGQLIVGETSDLSLFERSRPLIAAVGRVATLHRDADLLHTGLDIALHKILSTSDALGLKLGPRDTEHTESNIQALELASRYAFGPGRHSQDALGLAVLEGQIDIGLEDEQPQLLEPGSAAFIQQSSESPQLVVAESHGHATALLFAGSAVVPLLSSPIH